MAGRQRPVTDKAKQEAPQSVVSARRQAVDTVRDTLRRFEPKLTEVLPGTINARRLSELLMTEVARTPRLLECTMQSLVGAMIQCAQLGLMPGVAGQAYFLPFFNGQKKCFEAQLIPGYRGLLALAYNSGAIASVQCAVVREGDTFDFDYGFPNGFLRHRPLWRDDPEHMPALTHAWAMVHLKGSDIPVWEVMDRAKILVARSASPSVRGGRHSAWDTHEDEMWMKTVLRHLTKRLPASVERLQVAAALDERAAAGLGQDLGFLVPEIPNEPAMLPEPTESIEFEMSSAPEGETVDAQRQSADTAEEQAE